MQADSMRTCANAWASAPPKAAVFDPSEGSCTGYKEMMMINKAETTAEVYLFTTGGKFGNASTDANDVDNDKKHDDCHYDSNHNNPNHDNSYYDSNHDDDSYHDDSHHDDSHHDDFHHNNPNHDNSYYDSNHDDDSYHDDSHHNNHNSNNDDSPERQLPCCTVSIGEQEDGEVPAVLQGRRVCF
ncbi:hypothetical protein QR680_006302 [Steinernema hermaphroditum]|uniref:Uncharacterized protein n=1 Tax=Steinernema hermaphroditum TaxID=289476 RepID=A0AA39LX66_9BILA|nr:hypothetical protein QR680_006302 [Steinernema hermaphroditum]